MKKTLTILFIILIVLIGIAVTLEFVDFEGLKQEKESTSTVQEEGVAELQVDIIQEGVGSQVVEAGNTIAIHYTGWLTDGTKFDSSIDRGEPFSIVVGIGQIIPGFEQGVIGMKVGEKRKLTIPSNLAYGAEGRADIIPPNADLMFEVELLSIVGGEEELGLETIELNAVGIFEGSGTATRLYNEEEGIFTHTINAQLEDPVAGSWYEGWLVTGDEVIFTDMLRKAGDEYALTFESDEDLTDYTFVVVTLEEEDDEQPEEHVLEGEF